MSSSALDTPTNKVEGEALVKNRRPAGLSKEQELLVAEKRSAALARRAFKRGDGPGSSGNRDVIASGAQMAPAAAAGFLQPLSVTRLGDVQMEVIVANRERALARRLAMQQASTDANKQVAPGRKVARQQVCEAVNELLDGEDDPFDHDFVPEAEVREAELEAEEEEGPPCSQDPVVGPSVLQAAAKAVARPVKRFVAEAPPFVAAESPAQAKMRLLRDRIRSKEEGNTVAAKAAVSGPTDG